MRKERSVKMNILMCIAMILLCVTLFSLFVVSNMYARYTESIDNGDSARVAKFSIEPGDEFYEEVKAKTAPGDSECLMLEIKNDSEVAVEYTITVTKETNNIPLLKITLTPENEENAPKTIGEEFIDGDKKTSINISRQVAGKHTDKFKLKTEWPRSYNSEEDLALMGMVDYMTVSIKATQID